MPFVPVPAAILAEMIYDTPGGKAENTLWFTTVGTIDAAALTALAEALEIWHSASLSTYQGAAVALSSIRCTSMVTSTSPAIEYILSPAINGDAAFPLLPSHVTGAITFVTLFRGRSNRGRNFIIGLTENQVVNDTIDSGYVAAIVAAYETMRTDLLAEGFTHVVASRYSGVDVDGKPIPRVSGQTTPVTQYKMDSTIDSQRRRLHTRGQ